MHAGIRFPKCEDKTHEGVGNIVSWERILFLVHFLQLSNFNRSLLLSSECGRYALAPMHFDVV